MQNAGAIKYYGYASEYMQNSIIRSTVAPMVSSRVSSVVNSRNMLIATYGYRNCYASNQNNYHLPICSAEIYCRNFQSQETKLISEQLYRKSYDNIDYMVLGIVSFWFAYKFYGLRNLEHEILEAKMRKKMEEGEISQLKIFIEQERSRITKMDLEKMKALDEEFTELDRKINALILKLRSVKNDSNKASELRKEINKLKLSRAKIDEKDLARKFDILSQIDNKIDELSMQQDEFMPELVEIIHLSSELNGLKLQLDRVSHEKKDLAKKIKLEDEKAFKAIEKVQIEHDAKLSDLGEKFQEIRKQKEEIFATVPMIAIAFLEAGETHFK